MNDTSLDQYEKINIYDYFKGGLISFYKFSNLEKEELIVGKAVVKDKVSPPNPDTPLLYINGYGVLMKACENYWTLFESEAEMLDILNRFIFIRVANTEDCRCFNRVVSHAEILVFLKRHDPKPLEALSNEMVHSFFIPKIEKYLQVGVYTGSVEGPKKNKGIDLSIEYGPAVIYDTYEQVEKEYLEVDCHSPDNA